MPLRPLLTALALLLMLPPVALAQNPPSATELRLGLVGHWTGSLGYRDYQTNALFEIPVTTTITTPGDRATLVRQSLFDDGPDKPVWITTVSLDDAAAGTVAATSLRAGNTLELITEAVHVAAFGDATHWTLIYSRTGEDNDASADIRITETRAGDTLLEVKEVRPAGSGDDAWRFRNQTRLTRASD